MTWVHWCFIGLREDPRRGSDRVTPVTAEDWAPPDGGSKVEGFAEGCAEGVLPSDRGQDARDTTIGELALTAATQTLMTGCEELMRDRCAACAGFGMSALLRARPSATRRQDAFGAELIMPV